MNKHSLPLTPQRITDPVAMSLLTDVGGKKVFCKTFRTGDKMPPHHAPSDVFVLVLDGQLNITLEDETLPFQAGEWVVFPARITHALDCKKDAKVLIFR